MKGICVFHGAARLRSHKRGCVARRQPHSCNRSPLRTCQTETSFHPPSPTAKSLFRNIFRATLTRSIFCEASTKLALCFQNFDENRGEGGIPSVALQTVQLSLRFASGCPTHSCCSNEWENACAGYARGADTLCPTFANPRQMWATNPTVANPRPFKWFSTLFICV